MTYGIELRDVTGKLLFQLSDESLSVIDVIDVPIGSTDSKTYAGLNGWNLKVAQIQDTAASSTYDNVINFTIINVSITYSNGVPTVSWSPNASVGSAQMVRLIVLGN